MTKKIAIIIISVFVVVALGAGAYFVFFNKPASSNIEIEDVFLPPDKPLLNLSTEEMQQLEQQRQEYIKTLEEFPEYYETYIDLGNLERKMGRNGDAIKTFLKAHQINNKTFTPFLNMAVIYEENGYYDLAYQYYWEAQKVDPGVAETYARIADFYSWYYPQKQNEILDVYLLGINTAHEPEPLKAALAGYYFDHGQYQNSLKLWEELAKEKPDDQSIQDKIKEVKEKL